MGEKSLFIWNCKGKMSQDVFLSPSDSLFRTERMMQKIKKKYKVLQTRCNRRLLSG